VVTAARLHPQKGLADLVIAADLLRRRVPGLRWVVLGEGPQRGELERLVAARGLADVVVLAGGRPDVADELAAADAVAVTSRWESGPLVVLEALALGDPSWPPQSAWCRTSSGPAAGRWWCGRGSGGDGPAPSPRCSLSGWEPGVARRGSTAMVRTASSPRSRPSTGRCSTAD
jgi:hypothetical protein